MMPDANGLEDSSKNKDLRFTDREDRGVSITRDMSGQGHLARGSHTNMSNIRFSTRARSRDFLDPELAALHGDPPKPKHLWNEVDSPPGVSAGDAFATDVRVDTPAALPSMAGRIAQRLKRFFTGH